MAKNSQIEWTESTWNPWHGCLKVSPGCKNCYMYREKKRFGQSPKSILRSKTTFDAPVKWKEPRIIFTCSWSDWFIEEADEWRTEAWDVIRKTPHHTYQILTKRADRIKNHLPPDWGNGWENVWLGVSIENQDYVSRMHQLKEIPANIRFISAEPLLGPIKFGDLSGIHWIITGGESGPNARMMDIEWVRSIRDQCLRQKVAYFHKQHGGLAKIDGAWGGRTVDGIIWNAFPIT